MRMDNRGLPNLNAEAQRRSEKMTLRLRVSALGFALLASCGYAPVRRANHGVAVPPVRNETAQAEVAGWLQSELRTELMTRNELDDGGAPLEVALVGIRSYPSAMGTEGAAAWRVDAEAHARAPDFEDSAVGGEDYLAAVDVPGTEANRRAALRRLMRVLARELIERYDVARRMAAQ
jgi:hypothetical protein